ncbi:VOC family protein [Microbacterium sp. X-17]|uniref:VOC family protein n=1 Tax=Microbacterium sp. X-17 TaxID=3144404 RepID=UPI0031F5B040
MTNLSLTYLPIAVDDVAAATAFYRDTLGFDVLNEVANEGFHWVTLGVAAQPGLSIVLSEPGAGRSPDDAEALHRLLAKGSLGPYVFTSQDLDATFERVQASGTDVLQEPMDQPWGPRDIAFRDPAGNLIRVNQAG